MDSVINFAESFYEVISVHKGFTYISTDYDNDNVDDNNDYHDDGNDNHKFLCGWVQPKVLTNKVVK